MDSAALTLCALCLISLLAKHITVFFWFALFVNLWGYRRALLRMVGIGALWLLSFTPFLNPDSAVLIIQRVFLYSSWGGEYGLQTVLPKTLNAALFFVVMLLLPTLTRKRSPVTAVVVSVLAFFVFTYGLSPAQFPILLTIVALLNPLIALLLNVVTLPILYAQGVGWAGYYKNVVWASTVFALILVLRFRR